MRTDQDRWAFERQAWANGYAKVAGLDEAGRGPLAGPVVAGAVILPEGFNAEGIRDSKVMSAAAREREYDRIVSGAIAFGVGIVESDVIDQVNILRATHQAMKAALINMSAAFDFVLVDGLPVSGLPGPSLAIVKGDSKSLSISAASIVAKVTRDRIMVELHDKYPQYGFASHKGYYTIEHVQAIDEFGPCPCHRMTFAPICERNTNCRLPGLE